MDSLKISVVTVCYNAVSVLERTIKSVIAQSFPNIEYIIIDGGSTDGTIDVIKKYEDKISFWISEPDGGIYDAMNKGIKNANGDWIIFMNAGDLFYERDTLSKMSVHLNDAIDILRGNIIRVYDRFKVKSCGVVVQNPGIMDMIHNTFHHQACLIRKALFEQYGLYDTEYRLCADWKFFFDCVVLHHVKSCYVDITVASFRMDGASSVNTKKCAEEHSMYLQRVYGEELSSLLEELALYRKYYVSRLCCSFRRRLIENLSPKYYGRILNMKRICCSMLGLRVN